MNVAIPENSVNVQYHSLPRLFTAIKDSTIMFFNETYQNSYSTEQISATTKISFSTPTAFYATIQSKYSASSLLGKLERLSHLPTGSLFRYDLDSRQYRTISSINSPSDIVCSNDGKYVFVAEPSMSRVRVFETGRLGSLRQVFAAEGLVWIFYFFLRQW